MNIGILEPDGFSEKALIVLSNIGRVSKYKAGVQSVTDFIGDKDVLFVRLGLRFDKDALLAARHLKYLCSPTTGLNHIDLTVCKTKCVEVVSLKGESEFLKDIRATSEHTLGLILALLRNYKVALLSSDADGNRDRYRGHEVYKTKFGFIGFGRVATLVNRYLKAMGGETYYYDPNVSSDEAGKISEIDDLIDASEFVICSASYSNENQKLIDGPLLKKMKGKYFVNTARGELVDQDKLLALLAQGHFLGVALDVLTDESVEAFERVAQQFVSLENFIVTPHIAGATFTSMARTEEFIANKLFSKLTASG